MSQRTFEYLLGKNNDAIAKGEEQSMKSKHTQGGQCPPDRRRAGDMLEALKFIREDDDGSFNNYGTGRLPRSGEAVT